MANPTILDVNSGKMREIVKVECAKVPGNEQGFVLMYRDQMTDEHREFGVVRTVAKSSQSGSQQHKPTAEELEAALAALPGEHKDAKAASKDLAFRFGGLFTEEVERRVEVLFAQKQKQPNK